MKWISGIILTCVASVSAFAEDKSSSQQIVCEIAAEYLDSTTISKFEALSGAQFSKQSFVNECTRPLGLYGARDERIRYLQDQLDDTDNKSNLAIRVTRNLPPIAYMDLPRDAEKIEDFNCREASPCLLEALVNDTEVLMDAGADSTERLYAVNRISWHMARLHFPLSFGYADDLGGHWIRVGDVESCARNLNDFWAKCTVQLGLRAKNLDEGDVSQYAELLKQEIQPQQAEKWISDRPLLGWANQSYRIATSNKMGYCVWKKEQCRYSDEKLAFDPNGQLYDQYSRKVFVGITAGVKTQEFGVHSMTYKKLLLDDEYKNWAVEVTEKRLKQAGVRLAAYLAASL